MEFFLLIKIVCHPFISRSTKNLMLINSTLNVVLQAQADASDLQQNTLYKQFEKYLDKIINFALVNRTGILSGNPVLQATAKNILICLGW